MGKINQNKNGKGTEGVGDSDAPSAAPGDTNFRSQDFDMESKFSMDHDNNHEYVPEGIPNRKQEFHDFSKDENKISKP